jgi:hypothetical protein
MAVATRSIRNEAGVLRITPQAAGRDYWLRLEGCLGGAWVAELGACWIDAAIARPGRRIRIELADVCHVDRAGRELMTLMYRAGVRFTASGFVMLELVREIAQSVERERRTTGAQGVPASVERRRN